MLQPVQACPKAPYVLETPAGCLPQETGRLRADHCDAAWRMVRSGWLEVDDRRIGGEERRL